MLAVELGLLGEKKLEVVVEFGHRADGGTRRTNRIGLVNGNGGWYPFDAVDLGAIHSI